jgi:hypothetical protein
MGNVRLLGEVESGSTPARVKATKRPSALTDGSTPPNRSTV